MNVTHPLILGRMLRPLALSLRREVLEAVVAFKPDDDEEVRYHELADKNAENNITAEEKAELEGIVSGNTFLSLLRKEARAALLPQ